MFDDVVRIFAGRKLGKDAIAFNVITAKSTSKLPRYEPSQYSFIPKEQLSPEELGKLVKYLNLAVYANPGSHVIFSDNLTVAPVPKRFKVIINPKSGKGKAKLIYKRDVLPILQAAGCNVIEQSDPGRTDVTHVVTTTAAKQAVAIAAQLPLDHFDAILCVGGDGNVHDVVNGLANRSDSSKALGRIGIGTIPAGINPPTNIANNRIWYLPCDVNKTHFRQCFVRELVWQL
jgi:Diacylglycerol kinase catalytic domain